MRSLHLITLIAIFIASAASTQIISIPESEARPFQILQQSQRNEARTHRLANTEEREKRSQPARQSERTTTQRTTTQRTTSSTTQRPSRNPNATAQGDAYKTGQVRPAQNTRSTSNARSRTTTRTSTPSAASTRQRTTTRSSTAASANTRHSSTTTVTTTTTNTTASRQRSSPRRTTPTTTHHHHHHTRTRTSAPRTVHHHHHAPAPSSTVVHHHHHDSSASGVYTSPTRDRVPSSRSTFAGSYITAGAGMEGLAAAQITDTALPGAGFNLAVGGRSGALGLEVGFAASNFSFESHNPAQSINLMGLSADLKLQPTLLQVFEPYALIGVGGHILNDHVIQESAGGGSLRLGVGADIRFDKVAVGARYLHSSYFFPEFAALNPGLSAQSESLGLNVLLYF